MASALLAIYSLLPVVNAATVFIAAAVLGVCAFLARAYSHVPSYMAIPPIMLSGYVLPESVIYSSGFCIVAVGLLYSQTLMFLLRRLLIVAGVKENESSMHRVLNWFEYVISVVSIVSLVVQAVIPVQDNVLYTFFGYVERTQNTNLHESATICWWVSEALHWVFNFIVEKRSPQLSILRRYKSFKAKFVFVGIAIVCGLVTLISKAPLHTTNQEAMLIFNIQNLCWWISAAAFFMGYFIQSWQSAIILDHLGIRSFVFGSLRSHKVLPEDADAVPLSEQGRDAEEGNLHHRND